MGQVSTEQTVAIIEAVGDAVGNAQPDTTIMQAEPNMNFWPMLIIEIAPVVVIPFFLCVKKALSKRKGKR
jgi:hypothetical protein